MNFVTREEFDVVKKLSQDNRLMLEKIKDKKTEVKRPKKKEAVTKKSVEAIKK